MAKDDETASPENPLSSDPAIEVTGSSVKSSSKRRRSGGRDDCWSEEATEVLIDAWGERFLDLKRGNLKQQHWKQVAEIVNSERINNTSLKSDIQCKNRIDTVKKKFKQEKAKVALTGEHSRWVFFNKLKHLIGEASTPTPLLREGGGGLKRSGDSSSTRWHFRKRVASETESESEPDLSNDDDNSLPPSPPPVKILDKATRGGAGKEVGEVVMAIMGFAECYEKVETLKIKQMVELDKERMKFAKELELQRMQFFKSQLEMLRNSQEDDDGQTRRIKSRHSVKDNGNAS